MPYLECHFEQPADTRPHVRKPLSRCVKRHTIHVRLLCLLQKTSAHAGQAFALQLEDSDAYIEALKGCTFDEATYQGLQYIPTPADLCPDDTQHEVLAMLKEYASGTMPTASTPRSFLLAAGNPVGSTTGSITEVKYGNIPGAIEHFKSAQDLKEDAYRAFSQLRDTSAVLNIQQRDGLHCRWQVITGLSACPADLSSWENVPLCPDLHALAGVTRLYSGTLHGCGTKHP